ncbi:MAG: DMT family transporter [Alphaproteobacteria bacterium]
MGDDAGAMPDREARAAKAARSPAAGLPAIARGALWMSLAAATLSAMIAVIRVLSADFSTFQILFFRNALGLAIMLPWIAGVGIGALRMRRPGLQLLRVAFAYVAMLCWFHAVGLIPLADTMALKFTEPLFATLGGVLLLGERADRRRWAATAVGFLGMLVILRPGVATITFPALLVLASAACYSGASLTIRALSASVTPNAIVVYGLILMLPLSAGPAALTWTNPGWADLPWLLALGVAGVASQICLTRGLATLETGVAIPLLFLQLPFAAALGFVFFAEPLDGWVWAGAGIILVASLMLARHEGRIEALARRADPAPPA